MSLERQRADAKRRNAKRETGVRRGDLGHVVATLVQGLVQLLSPSYCAACDDALDDGEGVFCRDCGSPTPALGSNGSEWVAGTYAPPLSTAIARMKFRDRPDLAPLLARLLLPARTALQAQAAAAPPDCPAGDLAVAPVPLHFSRLAERGFNPAALMARVVARRWRAKLAIRALARVVATRRQTDLDRRDRARNVAGAFRVDRLPDAPHVVLVDDVVTTGATALACRRALPEAGVPRVSVVALARASRAGQSIARRP